MGRLSETPVGNAVGDTVCAHAPGVTLRTRNRLHGRVSYQAFWAPMSPTGGVVQLSPAPVDSVLTLLGHPVVAAVLGTALGVGLLFASRASFKAFTPEAPEAGLVFAAVSLIIRMALAAGFLFIFYRFVNDGFVPFAIGVAGGFLVLYTVELMRYGKVLARSR